MRYVMKTRDGETLEFWAPDRGGYVRLESGAKHGILGRQITWESGSTVECGPGIGSLKRIARKWRRDCLRLEKRGF